MFFANGSWLLLLVVAGVVAGAAAPVAAAGRPVGDGDGAHAGAVVGARSEAGDCMGGGRRADFRGPMEPTPWRMAQIA